MDIFRRSAVEHKKKVEVPPEDSAIVIALKNHIKDLELDIFDLKQANASLLAENTQLKAWNTSPENQSSDWFGKKNSSLSSTVGMEKEGSKDLNSLSIYVEGQIPERHSSESTDINHLPTVKNRLNRLNTLIFTNDSEFENFKINKLDIQMKCQVGKGSFGVVWKGLYKDNPVAVKLFISEEIDIRGEVYAMSKVVGLEHVMDLIGVVEEPGDAFKPPQVALVMPFMSNGSLQDICYKNSPTCMSRLSNEMKLKFCLQAAKGIMALHQTNIIHRDLACRNLLVDDKMDVFVADFGFARLKRVAESKGFTLTGLGPVRWEAPESLQYKEFSDKTDAFSYGVCMYEIVMGLLPWDHISSTAMVAVNVINGMRMIIPINCDPVLAEVMGACWNTEPCDRPDFFNIVRTLSERYQIVLLEQKDVERRIGTIEFMIRGENVNKLPHQIHKKKITKKPQQRFLRLTSDLKNIFWRSSTANSVFSSATRSKATERGIYIRDVLDVQVGQTTETFRLQQMEMPVACSFSLITAERSVDIVCESSYHRDLWVAGMRLLMTRNKATVMEAELSRKLTWSLNSEKVDLGSFDLLRKVAYRLQLGDMLLKFTSRKTHARHVFLSNDLTELVWSVKEEGPVRKGRNKSLLLTEIDRIVVGEQPSILHSNAGKQVSATAIRLSEKLHFRTAAVEHSSVPPPPPQTKIAAAGSLNSKTNRRADDEISQTQSKSNASSILSRLFKDKDEKDNKKKSSDRGLERSGDSSSVGALEPSSSFRSKFSRKDQRGSDRGSDVSSIDENSMSVTHRNRSHSQEHDGEHYHDDETDSVVSGAMPGHGQLDHDDHQLTISYLGFDGRTLLSVKCPNKELVVLWSDGVDMLLQGVVVLKRMSQAHQVHSYTHPRDLFADSNTPQRHYTEESVFNNIKTPTFPKDNKSLNIFSSRPFSTSSASATASASASRAASASASAAAWLQGEDVYSGLDEDEDPTPRAGNSAVWSTKESLIGVWTGSTIKSEGGELDVSGQKSSPITSDLLLPVSESQNSFEAALDERESVFQNMSPLSPHSNAEDMSTTTITSQSYSQDTRANIPSLEFTLSETDTLSTMPRPTSSSVQQPYLDDFDYDKKRGQGSTQVTSQKLPVAHFRSSTTSTGSSNSVVNSEALCSVEQREMERIRTKMLQVQASSSKSITTSHSRMQIQNKPENISTSHGNILSVTAGSSPMTEGSTYMLGDTLIHQGDSNKSLLSHDGKSNISSPYTMGDSMAPFPLATTRNHSNDSKSHSQGHSHSQSHSRSIVRRMSESSSKGSDKEGQQQEHREQMDRLDGIIATSSVRTGVLDSSSDEESITEASSLSHSDDHSDVDDSEFYTDVSMTSEKLTKIVLHEFKDDDSETRISENVYEVMPSSFATNKA